MIPEKASSREFTARLVVGAMIESVGIFMIVLQQFGILPATLFMAGTEDVTLLHLGAFCFVLGAGLQVRAVLERVKQGHPR